MQLVSVIIATRNRCNDLEKTLESFARVDVPSDLSLEVIVVDNGSSDSTPNIVRSAKLKRGEIQYLEEREVGKDKALNTAVRHSRGQILLFTDDDVEFPHNWIEVMCRPIIEGIADATAGGITMAKCLRRPWMKGDILIWKEVIEEPPAGVAPYMIGMNCAYSSKVFKELQFDEELDAGRLGNIGDILFGLQVQEAGFRITSVITKAHVVHHFDPSRLVRKSLVRRSITQGRSNAYVAYHWSHTEPKWIRVRLLYRCLRLGVIWIPFLLRRPPEEGITQEESEAIERVEFFRGLLVERKRSRQYIRRGLRKIAGCLSTESPLPTDLVPDCL